MPDLPLTIACWDYDRTRALLEERIKPDGISLTYLNLPVEETFFRMLRYHEFDVAEMSLSSYVLSLNGESAPFIAIPIFPSRCFRHASIYVSAKSGIRSPQDLIGKRVGAPEYQMTASVWIRGILAEEYGVPVESVTYYTGGEESPNRSEKLALQLPPDIRVQRIGPTQTLSRMLEAGEIDALYTARAPSSFYSGGAKVQRLFEDYAAVEAAYFEKTKIFPIMHTVVIRRRLYEQNRWIAQSLFKAFAAAQQAAYRDLHQTAALKFMLPWLTHHLEQTEAIMGWDFWTYGLQPNFRTLEKFLQYSHSQGLAARLFRPEELFAHETFESFVI
ncbi:MAG: ABC transporter substrate-binding protein [Dongiaceae bacterium]